MESENKYIETDLGNVAPNPRGEYDPAAAYEYLDLVEYGGGSYLCIQESGTVTGVAPTQNKNTDTWQVLTIPGDLTAEYIAMHDDVVNKAESAQTDAAATAADREQVESMLANVEQLHTQTETAAQEASDSRDSAAGYAAAAEASRTAAADSEKNAQLQVAGFNETVNAAKQEATEEITTARKTAVQAVAAQQVKSVNAVNAAGSAAIEKTSADAKEAKDAKAAAVSAANAAEGSAREATAAAEQAKNDTQSAETAAEAAKTSAAAAETAQKAVEGAAGQIETNKTDITALKEDLRDKANSPKDKKEIELDNLTQGGLIKVDGTILPFNGYEYGYTSAQLGDEFYVTGTSWKNTLPVFVEFDVDNNVVRSFTGDDSLSKDEMSTYKEQYFRVQNEKTTRVGFNGAENGEFKLAVKKNTILSVEEYVNQKTSKIYEDVDKLSIIKYGDCVKKPYTFKAKRCDVFGDSIARGWVHWDTTKYPITENNWVKIFCDKVGMTFSNHAVGGSTSNGVLSQITDAGKLISDYVFVAFGVNDWQDAIALNDFRNNVNAICNALKENFTGIDVIFVTPINHAEIIPHKTPIADLQEYRNIITEVALSRGYSVVQGNTFPFPDKNGEYASLVFGDNIHPTEKIGYPIYAKSLLTKIVDLENKAKNVVIYVGSAELSAEQKLSCDYVCDGVDDQIEIEQAIDSLPDSGGEIHLSRGIFNITNSICISKRIKLTGEGKGITLDRNNVNNGGTTLLSELTGGCIILIQKSDTLSDIKGITLSDFQIVGAGINVEKNFCNGINVTTYTDCVTLERLAICHCFFGLFVDQSATVDDISVTNCDFQRDSVGININGQGWQTRIENNIFWDMSGTRSTSGIVLSAGKNIVNGNYFGVSSLLHQDVACAWISAKNAVSLLCNGNSFSRCTSSPIRFEAGGQFASISGNSFSEIGKAQFHDNERAVLYVDGAGTGGGRISFMNNTVFWANDDDWKTSYLAYLTNQVAQVNISNNTVIDGIGKINEDELVYKSEDSAYAITIGNNVLC